MFADDHSCMHVQRAHGLRAVYKCGQQWATKCTFVILGGRENDSKHADATFSPIPMDPFIT